jgi:hypothetical protein
LDSHRQSAIGTLKSETGNRQAMVLSFETFNSISQRGFSDESSTFLDFHASCHVDHKVGDVETSCFPELKMSQLAFSAMISLNTLSRATLTIIVPL